jgi:hypothetical protein
MHMTLDHEVAKVTAATRPQKSSIFSDVDPKQRPLSAIANYTKSMNI